MNATKKIVDLYILAIEKIERLKWLPLLAVRLVLSYGFYKPASMKWEDIDSIADWFGSLGIPAPLLNAYLAAGTEAAGTVLLLLGLGVRFISIPLLIVMAVAIKTVHWENGFEAGDNGYEIPLYYMIMLVLLFVCGGGKCSLDYLIGKKYRSYLSR